MPAEREPARDRRRMALAVVCLMLAASACVDGAEGDQGGSAVGSTAPVGTTGDDGTGTISAEDFDPADFGGSTTVDNTYFPLAPGMRFVYEGAAWEGKQRLTRRVVMTVTALTKEILEVRGVTIWERDYTDGELTESELAFFAQDDGGNVWQLGEYPEEYEDGELVKTPTWFAGLAGATAGITMKADPQLGAPSYAQGFAPRPINWADRARVYQMDQRTCVPAGCYEGALVTEEFDRAERGAFQLKYYAPSVGIVRVGWRGRNEEEQETLVLVKVVRLGPGRLGKVNEGALAMETRAYQVSPDVYGQTLPLEVPEP